MKHYYKFRMLNRENVVSAGSMTALVKLEGISGLKFEPTGLKEDHFGKPYIEEKFDKVSIWDFKQLKDYIHWRLSMGEKIVND